MNAQLVELVSTFVKAKGGLWIGTATELVVQLQPYATHSGISHKLLQSSSVLSRSIKKYRKTLAAAGVTVTDKRTGRQRTLTLSLTAPEEPSSSTLLDWLDDAANYLVDRATRARVLFVRKERARIKAEHQEENERKLHGGFVVHSRPWYKRKPWDSGGSW